MMFAWRFSVSSQPLPILIFILALVSLPCKSQVFGAPKNGALQASDLVKSFQKISDEDVALMNVKIIDGLGNPAKSNQTLLIQKGRIVGTGHLDILSIPSNFKRLDFSGHTVIPGIVGTHNHMRLSDTALLFTSPRLYLACGVTTIQTCGTGHPEEEIAIGEAIERGEIPGTRIFNSSPYFTGPNGKPHFIRFTNEKTIRQTIRLWAKKGVKWFKVYRHTSPRELKVIIDEAHKNNAKVTGHLCATTYEEAAELGIDAIEHGFIHSYDHASGKKADTCSGDTSYRLDLEIDSDEVRKVHRALIDHHVALTSTPAIFEAQAGGRAPHQVLDTLVPARRLAYERWIEQKDQAGEKWYFKPKWFIKSMQYDLAFFRAGGLLTAGPDPGLYNLPGFGDQKNYELLIEAGFKLTEAVQVMTSNGAKLLGADHLGKIKAGMVADLVVIDGDLESNPALIENIEVVFKNGKGYDPKLLLDSVTGHVGSGIDNNMTYFGQREPGLIPEKFADHVISKQKVHEFGSVFSKKGDVFFFAVDKGGKAEILSSRLEKGVWSPPEAILSHKDFSFNDPMLSPDENRLFFISDKSLLPNGRPKDIDIWYLNRTASGWSDPVHLKGPVNSQKNEYYISFTNNSAMYFSSNIQSEGNKEHDYDIYKADLKNGTFSNLVKLPETVNSKYYDADVFIAPDESYIIFCSIRKGGYGRGDLYISFKDQDQGWTEARNLGEAINDQHHQLCPFVTKDGKYFFYTSNQDIYWVSTKILKSFRE